MRKVVIILAFLLCSSPLLPLEIELIEPEGLGPITGERSGDPAIELFPVFDDSGHVIMWIAGIVTDNTTSDVFQPFTFRITSDEEIDWSTLIFGVVSRGGDFIYPPGSTRDPWWRFWLGIRDMGDEDALDTLYAASELSYDWWIDTLSDSCWEVHIFPGPRVNPMGFVHLDHCSMYSPHQYSDHYVGDPGPCYYAGPVWFITGDTISPSLGQAFYPIEFFLAPLPGLISLWVEDVSGGTAEFWMEGFGIDYIGPVASDPYPSDGSQVYDSLLEIRVVVLDTYSYDYYPYPDTDGTGPPTEPRCYSYFIPAIPDSTHREWGEWVDYPYCVPWMVYRSKIDTTSIRLSVNEREYTISSPGMHWLHDSLLVLNTGEAGLTFERGETVRVCLEEATDRTSLGYGPNHLGRRWDWTHPDTPIPFCWEFYIAGTGIEEAAAMPEGFGIKSIKPNPFNSSVEITYTIPEDVSDNIELAMFDILGRRVESLPVEKTRGEHSVIWQPRDVSSGMYFVRMRASGQVVTKKLILLR
ncbi:T9SS type A sorting domain-containing protein [bacterium]|nr:T9SS type A sorting domain-containing protein [bacterium]